MASESTMSDGLSEGYVFRTITLEQEEEYKSKGQENSKHLNTIESMTGDNTIHVHANDSVKISDSSKIDKDKGEILFEGKSLSGPKSFTELTSDGYNFEDNNFIYSIVDPYESKLTVTSKETGDKISIDSEDRRYKDMFGIELIQRDNRTYKGKSAGETYYTSLPGSTLEATDTVGFFTRTEGGDTFFATEDDTTVISKGDSYIYGGAGFQTYNLSDGDVLNDSTEGTVIFEGKSLDGKKSKVEPYISKFDVKDIEIYEDESFYYTRMYDSEIHDNVLKVESKETGDSIRIVDNSHSHADRRDNGIVGIKLDNTKSVSLENSLATIDESEITNINQHENNVQSEYER